MRKSIPLHDISFGHVRQELDEGPEQRKRREKERKRMERKEWWDRFCQIAWKIAANLFRLAVGVSTIIGALYAMGAIT